MTPGDRLAWMQRHAAGSAHARRRGKMEAVRTCVGCRSRAPRSSLLRVVVRNSELVADTSATLPGRGAWLHPVDGCLDLALKRRAFGRALRVDGTPDPTALKGLLTRTG
ncbi:YlxR family protein [uncultured Leifsonia sp.]|uniref:YlxR family protein n=1 Tax=uncultured Leifsonia sp. TaxID=340359 RepID=UPI0028D179E6|nr:YlxR family protein [uncultured Leifsonia sp.]